jgi:hypothetical protein
MGGQRRRDVPGDVRRRCHHGPAEGTQDRLRHRVGGNADRDRVEARGGEIGHRAAVRLRHHQRQRPRPERLRQLQGARVKPADGLRGGNVRNMGDQRIEGRAPLGGIEMGDRGGIGGVRAEPVDRLGRKRDQPAGRQSPGGGPCGGIASR